MGIPDGLGRRLGAALLGVTVIGLAGCASSQPKAPKPPVAPQRTVLRPRLIVVPRGPSRPEPVRTVELGRSVQGRPIEATVFEGPGACIFIMGGIHGDEPLSSALVERLAAHLKAHPEDLGGARVILIKRANPDGLAAGTRWNARGVDLNRNFSTGNYQVGARHGQEALSEPESRALAAAIGRYQPSCIVSVHSPLNCIDADGGPASAALAREMSIFSPLPVKDLAALPGSLGSYAGNQLRLAMVTYELDRKDLPSWAAPGYLQRHVKPLLVAIERCGPSGGALGK